MREVQSNSEFVKSLKAVGIWAYKIADSPTSWTSHVTRFTPEKPADIIACTRSGRFLLIEGKLFKKWKGLYVSEFRDSQIKSLDAIVKQRGRAYVFLNIRIAKDAKNERENWGVIFDWAKHGDAIKSQGYTIKEMKAHSFGLWVKGSKGMFDLSRWLP
jgi:hypothetical protein